jgi:hypothetical protein
MAVTDDAAALARRRLMGWAPRCAPVFPGRDVGQDLVLAPGPRGLDLAVAEGIDCLAQDLTLALTTLLGSDLLDTAFGFDGLSALADETEPLLVQERLRIAVVAVLVRDPRVRRIIDVKLDDGRLDAPAPGSRELSVHVAFETLTDDRVAIDLGRLVLDA